MDRQTKHFRNSIQFFIVSFISGKATFMSFPFVQSTYTSKSVLHIPKLVCWAPTQIKTNRWLGLNGYEQGPIAALIKTCFEILRNLRGTKLNILWPSKGEGTQKRQRALGFSAILMLAPPKTNASLETATAALASSLLFSITR